MERSIKNATGRILAGFLAVLMVLSLFVTVLGELDLDFLRASASGDDGGDVLHNNTAYSNTDYSVLTGKIALTGDGFGKDISADLMAVLGDASVKYYDINDVFTATDDISLVVFTCGTQMCVLNNKTVAEFTAEITRAVQALKVRGYDVVLVTPGPVTEYGADNYYATHTGLWTPDEVASGINVTNRLSDAVAAVNSVAEAEGVDVISLYGKSKLSGEDEYMDGSADGIYPGPKGYTLMTRWIAEYVSENYVFARTSLGTETLSGEYTDIDLGKSYDDIDAVVLTFDEGTAIPEKISVQTAKAYEDQWFEAIADVEIKQDYEGKYVASLVFESATAQYIRISAEGGSFTAGTSASIYQTKLANPVVTYPVAGDEVTTKHAFNLEWSDVAGADRYDVVIADSDGNIVKKFTTSEDTQAIPTGLFKDGVSYSFSIESVCSGYVDSGAHKGSGVSGDFSAADDAVYKGSSETISDSVSAGKLVTLGDQELLSLGASATYNGTHTDVFTDGIMADYVGDNDTMIRLHSYNSAIHVCQVDIDLGKEVSAVTGVFFDAAFFAVSHSANAKPKSIKVYYGADGSDLSDPNHYVDPREMTIGESIRTMAFNKTSEARGEMTRFAETVGATNVRYITLLFEFENLENSDFWLDEIYVLGASEESGVIARDGVSVLNAGLVGANRFDGGYSSGDWITDPRFVAVAANMSAKPVELIVNLNADMGNNAIGHGNNYITGLELSFAVDTDAIRPSSIVVSIRKENETEWITVGGKVYIDHGTVSADDAEFVTEFIPLTMADASDVEAAYVKITLYSDIYNSSVPASFDSTGKWGKWFALSHMDILGGQYIESIEADGATAAYHANFLQNTSLVGRTNFGDVNNTDIWNTISWKNAPYATTHSGYLESNGNITAGKVYWASETLNSSAANATEGGATAKADSNLAIGTKYKYTVGTAHTRSKDSALIGAYGAGVLTNGSKPTTYDHNTATSYQAYNNIYREESGGSLMVELIFDLGSKSNVSSLKLYGYDHNTSFGVIGSSNAKTFTASIADTENGSYTQLGSLSYAASTKTGAYTATITGTGTGRYVKLTLTNITYVSLLSEIEIYGSVYSDAPVGGEIANVAPYGTYAYFGMLPGDGMGLAEGSGIALPEDYQVPNYSATLSSTIAQGGTGHRNTLGEYAKGKLNDNMFAIYSNGVTPYRWMGFYQNPTTKPDGMTIVFDLGSEYSIKDVYFRNPRRGGASNAGVYNVTYYFSDDNTNWTTGQKGAWAADGTLPQSSTNTTAWAIYKNSTTAPTGSYRYVKINIDNGAATGDSASQNFYLDEVVINGYLGVAEGPDKEKKNWALSELGGQYMGVLGAIYASYPEVYTGGGTTWDSFHSGKLNDGSIATGNPGGATNHVGLTKDWSTAQITLVVKLASRVDISDVKLFTGPYSSTYPSYLNVKVGETSDESEAVAFGETTSYSTYSGSTVSHTVNGSATGKYVFITTSSSVYLTQITEIQVNGIKSAQLDAPIITSHRDEQEIGVDTLLEWDIIPSPEPGTIVTYSVDVTDATGNTVSVTTGLTSNHIELDSTPFAAGEGYYTITVSSNANGWDPGVTTLVVYYAPKYILTFNAAEGAHLKSSGQSVQSVQFGIYAGSSWTSDEVLGAVSSIVALPYTGADGKVYYFSHWIDGDGNKHIPTSGTISANYTFEAQYTLSDTTGVLTDTRLTDGVIYDGRGALSNYYFTFTNTNQSYDYVIIDLGEIYYSLTEFDVSFYAMNGDLPFQITFEVSSKLYVPTISQGAAFDDADWHYVSVVQEDSYRYDSKTGRYSFDDDVKHAPIIDGAFGRYVKVTFYYDTDCDGVYVDEIMVSGSEEHDHTNIAEEKQASVGGVYTASLTDGVEGATAEGTSFIVELEDVKTGIESFQLVGAGNTEAEFLISAGGDSFYSVETVAGVNGTYKLSDTVSARRVKIVLAEKKAISEIRVFGDPGRENFYLDTGRTSTIYLKSGTLSLDNVVSLGAVDAKLYGTGTPGTATYANGALGSGSGFAMTDGADVGYANGISYVDTAKGRLWYGMYSSKKGINNYINAIVAVQWKPTLDSTAVQFVIGTKTYKFEFNGDVNKGFVVLQSGSAVPYSYNASRTGDNWIVEFTVAYADVSSSATPNIPVDLSYSLTAYEGTASVGATGTLTYRTNGTTAGWDYSNNNSSWTTISGYSGDVVAWMELDRVYYGLNTFAVSVLDAKNRGYSAPDSIRFQVSMDNATWTDVGYTAKKAVGDYRYYEQYQPSEAYVYNFSVNFEGISAKYVRAVMTVADVSKKVAVQEFWVNALPESLKISGGDQASNSFDYKMLWDDEYLYIALQYEEDEVPFYTASHDYYETYTMNYDTSKWNQTGAVTTSGPDAFAKSSMFYDESTGFFQLSHDITRAGDDNTTALGYSNHDSKNFKFYKVSSIKWNLGYTVSDADFVYGAANLASSIETSTTVYGTDAGGKPTLADTSVMNGYILVSDGYALSQDIDGSSLSAKPITVEGNTIPASQITNDLVWFFESSDLATEMTDYSKSLGDYLIYGFRHENAVTSHVDKAFFDGIHAMQYTKYYLTRAYQGLLWENLYTFPRDAKTPNTLFAISGMPTYTESAESINARNNHSAPDINWNVVRDSATGSWSLYLYSQGKENYNYYLDNVDGRSSFRLFMSVANLNDTARYDYGNFDFVLDTYILDDATITLKNGEVVPLTAENNAKYGAGIASSEFQNAWNGYKNVEFKSTALGMTGETNNYKLDVTKLKGKAKASQSANGQNLFTVEIAIPFTQLGFTMDKTENVVNKWGNFYTKMGIEKPLGKRTLMQFDSDYGYTADNQTTTDMTGIDEFYYYVDASEFGYVIQMAPEGKGYQDLSYTDGEGYATISSVRGEVLNTVNGSEIQYTPSTFEISKIHSTNADPEYADVVADLNSRDAFSYVEEDGIYYFTSQLDSNRIINQGGNISTELMIPAGGAYFSFDWKVQSETSDTLSVWLETTDTWNAQYADWIDTYNCGIPYRNIKTNKDGSWAVASNGTPDSTQSAWLGVLDYADKSQFALYSEILKAGYTGWLVNGVDLKNDACMAFISGYQDNTRNPENTVLASWKENKRSVTNLPTATNWKVNVDDVLVYSPIVDGSGSFANGSYRHVWDWNNVTMWIPNTTDQAISYTVTWMYWKNGSNKLSYNASDGRGTDDAQITNFRLTTTEELGYWKTSENWDTLRLDSTIADPTETMLGVKPLASAVVGEGEDVPAINASTNDPANAVTNTFGKDNFLTLSYAAIAATEEVGTTTTTTTYYQTKNRINLSVSNVPAKEIELYKNNAIVFTQSYEDHLADAGALKDWTILELKYNSSYNTWVLSRLFEEGVDKSRFNIHADNNTIIIAINYTYSAEDSKTYGLSREAVLFGYTNREVLKMLTPEIRYSMGESKIVETLASEDESLSVTQFITSNVFIRENYNVAQGKMYSLRNYPTYWDNTYMYTENWFRENNTEDGLAAFLAVYSETPLYYVNEKGEIEGKANTDGDYRQAFKYYYSSNKVLKFDTNQYGNVLYVPAGVGQLTDGIKMSVYSDTYYVESLADYAIGYFVQDGMGTPDADVIEDIDTTDNVYSYIQKPDLSHDEYEVSEDIRTREENVIIDLGSVEYGLSAFKLRFLGGGENGVAFPTSVEFAISTDGLSYSYIGSVALDDTAFDKGVFEDEYAHASVIFTGATDTVYGNTVADYTFDLQTVGVTARYIKATVMNHSAQNAKTFISEFQVIQNAIYPDVLPKTSASTWIDVSEDAILMYQDTLEVWDNVYKKDYAFALAPTQAGYLFAEDEGYADDGRANNNTNTYLKGELTDGIGGTELYKYSYDSTLVPPALNGTGGLKDMSVGWMKAYAAEVSLTFDMGSLNNVGYVSVYALESKDGVDKITMPYNVTAYVSDDNTYWNKVATVNANDNDSSAVSLKGLDVVLETDEYIVYRYNLTFARDGELGLQLNNYRYVKVVAETDGGEDGWICLTEVEVYEGHPCYPVIDLTDSKFEKVAIGIQGDDAEKQNSEVRPTFFRGFYDKALYSEDTPTGDYELNVVYNDNPAEDYTRYYVFGNVEQRALDGRGTPYFYGGDQLLLRVTNENLTAFDYKYQGDWVSTYKLLADSRIYYRDCKTDGTVATTRLFTTTAVPTPMTVCDVLARDKYTGTTPEGYMGDYSYYYLPIYLKNSLEYLKAEGYGVDKDNQSASYINMPENKVELTGTVKWDTNYESISDEYGDDKNGISLNLAPLGAKTNLAKVSYNGTEYSANTTLRFGSIWYIDDAAYYNTHTHRQQYGTLIMTLKNLSRYLTDTYPDNAPYTSVFEDYGLPLQVLNAPTEVTGVTEIKGVTEVVKLAGVTEVTKLSGVTDEGVTADNAKFSLVVDGATVYYTCNEDIVMDAANNVGRVWKSGTSFFYHADRRISSYKYTTTDGGVTKYWYCTDDVARVNWVDENGHWYSPDETVTTADKVYAIELTNGSTVYYYSETEQPTIKIMSRDSIGTAHYWTCNEDVPSWTYTTIDGNTTRYWYCSNYEGIAGGVVTVGDQRYATDSSVFYNGLITTVDGSGETRYWTAPDEASFTMLSALLETIDIPADYSFDEKQVMAGLDIFLEYANKHVKGKQGQNGEYLSFGGIVKHSRANKYYYFSNISTELVPKDYENGNIFAGVDSDKADGQNNTQLLGIYNYDHRYLEFDAILAGIPASQQDAKVVAVPYAIYANNYEFLEFGEHLGDGDAYVDTTWGDIFNHYYGGENASKDIRRYVYGGGIARSVTDVLAGASEQYD